MSQDSFTSNLDLAREWLKENPDMTVGDAVFIKSFARWLDGRSQADTTGDCIACSVGNPGVYIKDGQMVCPHRPVHETKTALNKQRPCGHSAIEIQIDESYNGCLICDYDRLRTALTEIGALRIHGASPIGALHGAGMASGFEIAAGIAKRALGAKQETTPRLCGCAPDYCMRSGMLAGIMPTEVACKREQNGD